MSEMKFNKDVENEPRDTSETRIGEEPGSEVPATQSTGLRPNTAAGADESPADEESTLLEKSVEDIPPISEELKKEILGRGPPSQQEGFSTEHPNSEPKTTDIRLLY
uniref:Uncharacterized protein n=1 Tax=Caenorhabditis japonica TaxID=281687 RepID=A0A8R1IUT4_CAEJA